MSDTAPEPIRVRLRYPDVASFCARFAPNVTRGGIFLASKELRDVGALLRFEICLQDGSVALSGEGKVTWIKEFNPAEPTKAHGMGVQFVALDEGSRPVLDQLLAAKEAAGRRNTMSVPIVAGINAPGSGPKTQPLERNDAVPVVIPTEFDRVEESTLRRIVDRARVISSRTEDVEALLKPDDDEAVSVTQALSEMGRYLAPPRRNSGLFRLPPETGPGDKDKSGGGNAE